MLAVRALLVCLAIVVGPGLARAASSGTGLFTAGQPVPVVSSSITVDVHLGIARGTVTQRFHNDRAAAIEAVYVFPLPPGATIESMEATVGGTRIRGTIARRAEAAAAYQDAVTAGRAAALVEIERPGVFTQSLSPVPPGGDVEVTLRWQVVLDRRDGAWELVHPLVVGPRYVPGAATGRPTQGGGTSTDTDRAPDASRVTPPSSAGAVTPFLVALTLDDATDVTSPSHPLTVAAVGKGPAATVAVDDRQGDRELVVRWRSRAREQVRAFVEPAGGGAYVAVLVEPAVTAAPAVRAARRWVLAIDRSPSLRGAGAAASRALGHALLDGLPAGDTVAVIGLGQPATPARDRAAAGAVLDALPEGSADLTRALASTLAALPRDPRPEVVLITDGLVADDAAAIERAAAGGVVVHTVGIGAAPNRWLLGAIARRTGGTTGVLSELADAPALVATIVASDRAAPVTVDWRRPAVIDTEASSPRVGPGQAALLVAIDPSGVPSGEIEVSIGGRTLRAKLERGAGALLPSTWAALRVQRLYSVGDREAATLLALERGLVSPTTALLATTTRADEPVRSVITVPVPAPAGTRLDALRAEQRAERQDSANVDRTRAPVAPAPPPTGGIATDNRTDGVGDVATAGEATLGGATSADNDFDDNGFDDGDSGGGSGRGGSDDAAPATEFSQDSVRTTAAAPGSDAESALGRALDRHFITASLGLGVRLDEGVPAAQLSLGAYRQLPRFFAVGVRGELGVAPVDDNPVTAAGVVSLSTVGRLPVRFDVGVGLGWSGGVAAAYDIGAVIGRHGVGLALRLIGLAGPGVHPVTISAGVEAAF